MKSKLLLLLISFALSKIDAQTLSPEVIATSGNTMTTNNLQLDWTLGEVAITTLLNNSQQITQGFHQPNYIITSVDEPSIEIANVNVFPNPTIERIEIKISFNEVQSIRTSLYDINSRIIWTKDDFGQEIHRIENIQHLPIGSYFLNITSIDNQYSQTFKIQKIN